MEQLAQPFVDEFVDPDRQRHFTDGSHDGKHDVVQNRVPRQPPERVAYQEDVSEIVQPAPRTVEHQLIVERLKRQHQSAHRYV